MKSCLSVNIFPGGEVTDGDQIFVNNICMNNFVLFLHCINESISMSTTKLNFQEGSV